MKENTMLNRRITVIDALRGFALLGVLLVHMSQHYSYASADLLLRTSRSWQDGTKEPTGLYGQCCLASLSTSLLFCSA